MLIDQNSFQVFQIMASENSNPSFSTETFSLNSTVSGCDCLLDTDVTNTFQKLPSRFCTLREANQHIGTACKLRSEYQQKRAHSLRRLQQVLDEVKWIDDKISEVDIHIADIYYVVDNSGLETILASKEHVTVVEGCK